jgi:hypothetical protein
MTDFREEAYILEKVEISDDEEDGDFQYEEIKDTEGDMEASGTKVDLAKGEDEEDDDLDNFEALKAKTTLKMLQQ